MITKSIRIGQYFIAEHVHPESKEVRVYINDIRQHAMDFEQAVVHANRLNNETKAKYDLTKRNEP